MSRCVGVEPIASRTPNSRVRALTENVNTPATPTIAMSSPRRFPRKKPRSDLAADTAFQKLTDIPI